MDKTNTTNEDKYLGKPLTAAEKRKYAKRHQDAILALHGIAPVKTRRAPRTPSESVDRYIVLTSTVGADEGPKTKFSSKTAAQRWVKSFLADEKARMDIVLASICKIEDEDMALEIWGIKDGKVVQVA